MDYLVHMRRSLLKLAFGRHLLGEQEGIQYKPSKLFMALDDVDANTWFTKINDCHVRTRQAVHVEDDGSMTNSLNLVKPKSNLDVRRNFFSCRVVNCWNNLPTHVQEATDVGDFKVKYDEFIAGN